MDTNTFINIQMKTIPHQIKIYNFNTNLANIALSIITYLLSQNAFIYLHPKYC